MGRIDSLHLGFKGWDCLAESLAQDPNLAEPQDPCRKLLQGWSTVPTGAPAITVPWKAELWAKENYSQTLRSCGVCHGVWTYSESVAPFFFLSSPSSKGMSVLCLSHLYILEAHNLSGFTDSQLERNWPQNDCTVSLTHIWFRWYSDKTLNFMLPNWVKTWGNQQWTVVD